MSSSDSAVADIFIVYLSLNVQLLFQASPGHEAWGREQLWLTHAGLCSDADLGTAFFAFASVLDGGTRF